VLAAARALDRAAFSPDTLPDDLVIGLALVPSVAAGLIIFKLPALEMLLIAAAAGTAGQFASRLIFRRFYPKPESSPFIAAVIGVALVGPAAPLLVTAAVAVAAVALELVRSRYAPAVRAQAGLIAFTAVALLDRAAAMSYVSPSGASNLEPIAIWRLFPPGAAPIDPIRLYVGNVPGPVFATSLMAVVIGVAWLAYAKRLSPVVAVGFLLGAIVPIAIFHWDFVFQLDSGPLWFVGAMILSDRRQLPDSWAIRPILGFVAGFAALALRYRGFGIEAAFYAVAAVQVAVAIVVILIWSVRMLRKHRERTTRLRRREQQLRSVVPAVEEPADPSAVA
jgi:NQR2/RnfD/RnfE family subunit of NADH-ubiquinone oxidoreductase